MSLTETERRFRRIETDTKRLHDEVKILHNLYKNLKETFADYIRNELKNAPSAPKPQAKKPETAGG